MATGDFGPFSMKDVKDCFESFDLDRNSFVGAGEMRHVFKSIGEDVTDAEIDEMIRMVDQDGDGQLTLPEFAKMVFRYAAKIPGGEDDEQVLEQAQQKTKPAVGISAAAAVEKQAVLMEILQELAFQESDLSKFVRRYSDLDKLPTGGVQFNYDEFCKFADLSPGLMAEKLFGLFAVDEKIDPREFLVAAANFGLGDDKMTRIKFAFDLYDEDGDKTLSRVEITKILKANYMAESIDQVQKKADAIMRQGDVDGNNEINFEEFQAVCLKFPNLMYPTIKKWFIDNQTTGVQALKSWLCFAMYNQSGLWS